MNDTATEMRSVILERELPYPPEKLWRALTQPHLIAEWLMQNDFQPAVGHAFKLRAEPQPGWDGIIDCEVLVVDPLKKLSYTWNALSLESVVLFTLTPAESGTNLRMEHSGFRPDQQQAYGGAKYGWTKFLDNLDRILNGGAQ